MSRRALAVLFLTVFVDLLGFGLIIPLLPVYAAELNAGDATIGLLLASFSLMQFLTAPLWGRLSDRVGRRPVLLLGLVGSAVFYAIFGLATQIGCLTLLFVSRIGGGIMAATIPTAQAYIADVTTPEKRASSMALLGMAFGLGFTFGPLIGAAALAVHQAGSQMSPLPGYIASALSSLGLLLGLIWLPEPVRRTTHSGERAWLAVSLVVRGHAAGPALLLILASFMATFAFSSFETTLARFLRDVFHFPYVQLLLVYAAIGFAFAVAQGGIVRPLARRVSEHVLINGGGLLLAAGLLGLAASAHFDMRAALLAATLLTVLGYAALPPAIQSLLSRCANPGQHGLVLGAGQSASALARIIGPVVGNILYGLTPAHDVPYIFGALVACAVVALHRGRPAEETSVA